MSQAEKFVKSLYPDAYCLEFPSGIGDRYQVVYDPTGRYMPTYYLESKEAAWRQAEERINERILMKLQS